MRPDHPNATLRPLRPLRFKSPDVSAPRGARRAAAIRVRSRKAGWKVNRPSGELRAGDFFTKTEPHRAQGAQGLASTDHIAATWF